MPPHTIDPMPIIAPLPEPEIDWTAWQEKAKAGEITDEEKQLIRYARLWKQYAEARDQQINIYNGIAAAKNAAAEEQKKEIQ